MSNAFESPEEVRIDSLNSLRQNLSRYRAENAMDGDNESELDDALGEPDDELVRCPVRRKGDRVRCKLHEGHRGSHRYPAPVPKPRRRSKGARK